MDFGRRSTDYDDHRTLRNANNSLAANDVLATSLGRKFFFVNDYEYLICVIGEINAFGTFLLNALLLRILFFEPPL